MNYFFFRFVGKDYPVVSMCVRKFVMKMFAVIVQGLGKESVHVAKQVSGKMSFNQLAFT